MKLKNEQKLRAHMALVTRSEKPRAHMHELKQNFKNQ